MILNRTMVEVWNKSVIALKHKKSQQDQNVADRPTRFEACRVSTWSCKLHKIIEKTKT